MKKHVYFEAYFVMVKTLLHVSLDGVIKHPLN